MQRGDGGQDLMIYRCWVQAVIVVILFGFFVLGFLAYRTYTGEPPIPAQVVDPAGQILFERTDIMAGQAVFHENGLMEYGSILVKGLISGRTSTPIICIARP